METIYLENSITKSLKNLIEDANFDYVNPDILNQFGNEKPILGKINCRVFHFGKPTVSAEVEKSIYDEGYEPASIFELIGFAIELPKFQCSTPVVALGSKWQHSKEDFMVPALWGGTNSRELNLCSRGTHWFKDDVFLARKIR